MSANATAAPGAIPVETKDRAHHRRLAAGYAIAVSLIVALAVYGFDYYRLSSSARPFSPKHTLLRPSGAVGLKLGFLGLLMFLMIFLYPLRKKWAWLGRQGSARHWLDFHVLLGLAAPFVIVLHSAFKFSGFAGTAFFIMVAVSASGVIGRYLYSQIPRSLNAAEISLSELNDRQARLAQQLAQQKILRQADLHSLLHLPSREMVQRLPIVVALVYVIVLDLLRVFRIAKLRRGALPFGTKLTTVAGFVPTRNFDLEKAIQTAKEEASLSKRVLFLARSQQVFHLWHVVHKPFSYSFAVLALIHIAVVMLMGYF